jgi:all-trans-retinol dehydrogenase (NAD+)
MRWRLEMELYGRNVLITGAARGMGRLEALAFAREGAKLIITDVDAGTLDETVGELRAAGHSVRSYVVDVSDRTACFELSEKVAAEAGTPDVLVNNAGIVVCDEVLNMSERDFRRMMDVNYFGMIWMMQAFVPAMVARGSGHVVNMCSSAGKMGVPRLGGYCATKFAAIGITDTIRPELKKTGVKFTIVNPGYVNTGMFGDAKVPFITRWQEPGAVADAIAEAVKHNHGEICVPRFAVRFATFMRGLCVPRITDPLNAMLGGHSSFESWQKDESRPF